MPFGFNFRAWEWLGVKLNQCTVLYHIDADQGDEAPQDASRMRTMFDMRCQLMRLSTSWYFQFQDCKAWEIGKSDGDGT